MTQLTYDRFFQPIILARANGQDADDLVMRMGQVEINEDPKRSTKVTIDFEVFEPSTDFSGSLLEDDRMLPGAVWELRWGYFSDISDPLAVRVTHYKPDFKADGTVVMRLFLHDKQVAINRDTRSYNWGRVQSSQIASQIAQRYGMNLNSEESDDARQRAYVQPATMGDIQYLQSLAQRIGFVCFVESNTLHYHRPDYTSAPVLDLYWYGAESSSTPGVQILQQFMPNVKESRRRRTRQAGEEDGEQDESTAGDGEQQGDYVLADLVNRRFVEPPASQEANPEEERRLRRRRADVIQRNFLRRVNEADIVCLGTPKLRRNTNVQIKGVGVGLSGTWHLKESTHTLGQNGSYVVKAKLNRGAYNQRVRNQSEEETNNQDQDAQDESGGADTVIVDLANRVVVTPSQSQGDSE